ncbi:hypothetical protein CRYUN_Cryun02cG0102800 [Craigia yunnanensis]
MRRRKNDSSNKHPNLSEEEKEKQEKKSLYSSKNVLAICLGFRMLNALLIQTYFNPDEHWQALEVAHLIAFGYGHLTWEWEKGIRSYLHPMVFTLFYKLLALLGLDTPWFMLFSQLANWFMFFCFNRTLSNSLETVLTLVGLYYWPSMRSSSNRAPSDSRKWGLALAALACAIRPTSAIIWVYVGLLELYLTHERLGFIFLELIPIGTVVLGLMCLLDRLMYGSWVLVPLNFLKFNFLSSGGDYYGTHKWHWYFTQGFSVMLFSFLPFCVAGIIKSKYWKLSGLILWVLGLYSILGHKEFREVSLKFVLPVLPISLIFSGYSLAALEKCGSPNGKRKISSCIYNKWPSRKQLAIFFLLATNIPMALYMSLVHQRGTEDVMNYISKEAVKEKVKSILFLMPCHATPYYSTLHRNLPMRFLDFSPSEEKGILDESDCFMMDPVGFAVRRFFHAHFKVDRDLQASVVVYAMTGT